MKKTAKLCLTLAALLCCASAYAAEQTGVLYTIDGEKIIAFDVDKADVALPAFSIPRRDGKAGAAVPIDSGVPADVAAQLGTDLNFIATLQGGGATKLHQKVFGPVSGPVYFDFFTSRVKSIGINACGGGMAVACVIPYLDSSKMWITKNYIKFSHPQIARLMVVFHEARHTEVASGFWSHATCPTPFELEGKEVLSIWTGATLAGEPACDSTPFGSYGSSTIMLKNISKHCSNCTGKVKEDAGMYAEDQLKRITNPQAKQQMLEDFQS